jgi:hypothetical protein
VLTVRSTVNYDKLLFCVLLQDVSQYTHILCNVLYSQTQLIESIITIIIMSFNLLLFFQAIILLNQWCTPRSHFKLHIIARFLLCVIFLVKLYFAKSFDYLPCIICRCFFTLWWYTVGLLLSWQLQYHIYIIFI